MKCVNCGSAMPVIEPDYDVPAGDGGTADFNISNLDKIEFQVNTKEVEVDFGVSCDVCKKNKKISTRLIKYVEKLKKETNVGTWYLNEFKKILGEEK